MGKLKSKLDNQTFKKLVNTVDYYKYLWFYNNVVDTSMGFYANSKKRKFGIYEDYKRYPLNYSRIIFFPAILSESFLLILLFFVLKRSGKGWNNSRQNNKIRLERFGNIILK